MTRIADHLKLALCATSGTEAVVQTGSARFTILTERLIRLEYQPEGRFEDRASQTVWFRDQPVPEYSVRDSGQAIEIETAHLLLHYDCGQGFDAENLSIQVKALDLIWRPGMANEGNLHGTTRTLDFVNGATPLEPGLMSREGWALLDDSTSLVFNDEHWLEPREASGKDCTSSATATITKPVCRTTVGSAVPCR